MVSNERRWTLLGGALGLAAGASFMYLADPDRGRRRRATARDKIGSYARRARHAFGIVAADVVHRTYGRAIDVAHRIGRGRGVDDDVLVERIRARLGHVLEHPIRVEVGVTEGNVVLQGDVPESEATKLFAEVRSIRGTRRVDDRTFHYEGKTAPDRRARGSTPPIDPERAARALELGDIDGDPRTTAEMLDELGMRFSAGDD